MSKTSSVFLLFHTIVLLSKSSTNKTLGLCNLCEIKMPLISLKYFDKYWLKYGVHLCNKLLYHQNAIPFSTLVCVLVCVCIIKQWYINWVILSQRHKLTIDINISQNYRKIENQLSFQAHKIKLNVFFCNGKKVVNNRQRKSKKNVNIKSQAR